jgi:hypothetical protein
VLIQWCLKGIRQTKTFSDSQAADVLRSKGLASAHIFTDPNPYTRSAAFADAHAALSTTALDDHVNNFSLVAAQTPYISLGAGCRTIDPVTGAARTHSALDTAIDFATGAVWGAATTPGYVFKMWLIVTPKPAPALPGYGEEVRDLNIFEKYTIFHTEGEIAGKLVVPHRQIASVTKYDRDGVADASVNWLSFGLNPGTGPEGHWGDYLPPETVNNVRDLL